MHSTSRLLLEVPDNTDPVANYPGVSGQQMSILDKAVLYTEAVIGSRPAANSVESGHVFRPTDLAGVVFVSDGAAWQPIIEPQSGTLGSRPAAGHFGRRYYATDHHRWSLDNGTSWDSLGLMPVNATGSVTAEAGQLISFSSVAAAVTVTLPTWAEGATVGVFAGGAVTSVHSVTVETADGASIFGVGVDATAVTLGTNNSHLVLVASTGGFGDFWEIVAGQQDTGWVPLTLVSGFSASGGTIPSARLQGDVVRFKGTVENISAGTYGSAAFATVPVAMPPSATAYVPISGPLTVASVAIGLIVDPGGGVGANQSFGASGTFVPLDGATYVLS